LEPGDWNGVDSCFRKRTNEVERGIAVPFTRLKRKSMEYGSRFDGVPPLEVFVHHIGFVELNLESYCLMESKIPLHNSLIVTHKC